MADTPVRVVLVLDTSAGVHGDYLRGRLGPALQRVLAVAGTFDDTGTISAWRPTVTTPKRLPDITLDHLADWVREHVGRWARTPERRPGLDPAFFTFDADDAAAVREMRLHVAQRNRRHPRPTLVLLFSGGTAKFFGEIDRQLREAPDEPVFWQYVGVGKGRFRRLAQLTRPRGRGVDNVGLLRLRDLADADDDDLRGILLPEFEPWLDAATAAGIVR